VQRLDIAREAYPGLDLTERVEGLPARALALYVLNHLILGWCGSSQ